MRAPRRVFYLSLSLFTLCADGECGGGRGCGYLFFGLCERVDGRFAVQGEQQAGKKEATRKLILFDEASIAAAVPHARKREDEESVNRREKFIQRKEQGERGGGGEQRGRTHEHTRKHKEERKAARDGLRCIYTKEERSEDRQ